MPDFTIKTPEEIKKLKVGGNILAKILKVVSNAAKPGTTTLELDNLARKLMAKYKVKPSFLNYGTPPYPAVLCTSINEGIVHCIPNNTVLKEGDIIGLDCGIWHEGLCTDMAVTVGVGKISRETKKLVDVTKKSLDLGLEQIKPGNTLGDIGHAIQSYAESFGFGVVRELVGHGVGYQVHEDPHIPNYGQPGKGLVLQAGMVLAIEPMITAGDWKIEVLFNGWDIATKDRSLSAHFEHTIAVTKNGCEILTK